MPAPSTTPLRVRPNTRPALRPLPLLRLPEPFDHSHRLFEVKHDGFRALAHIDGHHCALVSRNGTFKHWPHVCEELAHAVKAHDAVIDAEIVCLDARGRSNFKTCCSGASGRVSTRSLCSPWTAKTCESGR